MVMSNMRQLLRIQLCSSKTNNELEQQTCPSQVEGQTFPSHVKQNKGTGNGIRSWSSHTRWEPQVQIPTRSVHPRFRASSHESSCRCAFHISILPTRNHTCFRFLEEIITLQFFWIIRVLLKKAHWCCVHKHCNLCLLLEWLWRAKRKCLHVTKPCKIGISQCAVDSFVGRGQSCGPKRVAFQQEKAFNSPPTCFAVTLLCLTSSHELAPKPTFTKSPFSRSALQYLVVAALCTFQSDASSCTKNRPRVTCASYHSHRTSM